MTVSVNTMSNPGILSIMTKTVKLKVEINFINFMFKQLTPVELVFNTMIYK